jgi:hypothetical protein
MADQSKRPQRDPAVSDQADGATGEAAPVDPRAPDQDEHEGATDEKVGDRTGPGAGYDQEPEQEKDKGGVA